MLAHLIETDSVVEVGLQAILQKGQKLLRNLFSDFGSLTHLLQNILFAVAESHGSEAMEQLVDDDPERPDIGFGTVDLTHKGLRSHVFGSA